MDLKLLEQQSEVEWRIPPHGAMCVPGILYGSGELIRQMDAKVYEQVTNVASLPGIVKASFAMPDAHWGYGFPIGGVAAFDADEGGVVSAGGVGFDVSCLAEDAQVLHEHGYTRPIGQLLSSWQAECVKLQDFTVGRLTNTNLVHFFRKRPDTHVYTLKTTTGRTITATADHPFYTPKDMIPLEKIQPGDRVALCGFKGVGYEKPSSEVILSEAQMKEFLSRCGKGRAGNALTQLLNQLKRRNLIPLRHDSPATPYLLKLIGFVMGDGTLTWFKDGSAALGFYGRREDLEDIRADLAKLGFSAISVYCRERRHSIKTYYRQVEFSTVECMTRCGSTALALLLAALGCPVGNKTEQAFRVPHWIYQVPLWQKRLFLSAYFGAEMSTPAALSARNFYMPTISLSKEISHVENARQFLADLGSLLADFGISLQTISRVKDDYQRKGGGRSGRYRLMLSGKPVDLIALYERVGFSYNHRKMSLGLQVAHYLRLKAQALEKRITIAADAQRMHKETAQGALAIHRALGSPQDICLGFIRRSIYEGRRTIPRVWNNFPTFKEFAAKATVGLGTSGMVWDTVIAKEMVERPQWVYDFTVNHPSHNFIANEFLVSNCGIRTLHTGLNAEQVFAVREKLADALFKGVPAGVGSTGKISLNKKGMHDMLSGGARWAVEQGYGREGDLDRIEEGGCAAGAQPQAVSDKAKERQQDEMGTLGSGNHYLEIQRVAEVFEKNIARGFGLNVGDAVLSIHCGSRGLGHQVGTDFLKEMVEAAPDHGLRLVDRELACAPIHSPLGQRYLGAMRAAINCALANRQIITHLAREAFAQVLPQADLRLLYDVSHNTCKVEEHEVDGRTRRLFVHRKGATRAYGPGNPAVTPSLRVWGQPVLIGGTMGTASYILAGTEQSMDQAFGSSCHGAGRNMSRTQATKQWHGREVIEQLARQGILIRAVSARGVAEEAPGAYKDVTAVVDAAQAAGLSCKVARLVPMICIKG